MEIPLLYMDKRLLTCLATPSPRCHVEKNRPPVLVCNPATPLPHQGLTLDDLRIVPEEEQDDDADMEGDSDDEAPGLPWAQANDEMTITALNLLLSILEGTLFCLQALFNILLTVPISKSDTLLAVSSHSGSNSRGC